MMKSYTSILLLTLCLTGLSANAQTPFDSFAPETSRPMLGLDAITARETLSQGNGFNDSITSTESSADDISKWLSVDPLADKYPNISPYAYCGWNPVKYIDPDGEGVFPSSAELREAGERIMNDPKYTPHGATTFCNMGAQAINALSGDFSVQGLANDMGRYLRNTQNATEISQEEALEYANMGVVVFASYISEGGGHGHIAIVAPTDELSYSASQNGNVVSVFNIGRDNGEMPLGRAFGKLPVGLFILNEDIKTINDRMSTSDGGMLQEILVLEKWLIPRISNREKLNVETLSIDGIKL